MFHLCTVLFWFLFAITSSSGIFAYIAVIVAAVMLTYEHILVNRDFTKIDKAFFTVNGYLGIVFFFLILIDSF